MGVYQRHITFLIPFQTTSFKIRGFLTDIRIFVSCLVEKLALMVAVYCFMYLLCRVTCRFDGSVIRAVPGFYSCLTSTFVQ